jgi:hypothetical protein
VLMGPLPRCSALGLALASACTPTTPGIEALDDVEDEPSIEDREWSVPDGEVEPEPRAAVENPDEGDAPRIVVRSAGEHDESAPVESRGFPAIDAHGDIAIPLAHLLMLSNRPGRLDLTWLAADGSTRTDPIVTDDDVHEDDESAARLHRNLAARARRANAALATHTWRALEHLPIELGYHEMPELDPPPADQRPVQAVVQHGELIVRIPGVRVLERHDLEIDGDFVHRVYADRDTGTALVVVGGCEGEDCTCDPGFAAQRMQWSEATFTAIDAHPCITRADQLACDLRPMPFEEPLEPWEI